MRFYLGGVCDRSTKMPIKNPSARSCALEAQVRRTVQHYGMLIPGDHAVVAVSGGADSTALLLCLHSLAPQFHLEITVAHLNHCIRGPEGDADEDFVRRMSEDLGLPFISETIDIKRLASEARRNVEDFAREKRYDFLLRIARRVEAQKVAVAHNLNDQAETVLLRVMRGSGFEGLSGIHPVVEGMIIRPLFECSRDAILEYLKQLNVHYRVDSTNADLRHARNRIRQELLPYLEEHFNPKLAPTLAREAGLVREVWTFLESEAEQAYANLSRRLENGISLSVKDILQLHPAVQKQVLRHALRECSGTLRGITAAHLENALSLCRMGQSGRRILMPRGIVGLRQFGELLLLVQEPTLGADFAYELTIPGRCDVAEAGMNFLAEICSLPAVREGMGKLQVRAFLESDSLPPTLTVRSRLPGDRYGGPGHRKVKKMLIGRRIPRAARSILPMVAAGNNVVWIPGFRPARSYEARPDSETCVMVEAHRSDENK
jgi:tRNA(Ile)-lysidine synthase